MGVGMLHTHLYRCAGASLSSRERCAVGCGKAAESLCRLMRLRRCDDGGIGWRKEAWRRLQGIRTLRVEDGGL